MPRSTSSGSSERSYYTARSDYDTIDDYYSNLAPTSADLRSRTDNPPTWPLRSSRTDLRLSERSTRGYNPSYYGDIAPVAGSSPQLHDTGYQEEDMDNPTLDTPMATRYRQYKELDSDSRTAEREYKDRLNEIPRPPPRKHRTGEYGGNPAMTSIHHRQLAPHSANMVEVSQRHIAARASFDVDYVGHYRSKSQRRGHTQRIQDEEDKAEKLRARNDNHRQWGYGEDRDSQKEAKKERIRANEERHKRLGYEPRENGRRR